MAKKSGRRRKDRRVVVRVPVDELLKELEKLTKQEPGGSPKRPLEVGSAAVIEPRARAASCLRCSERSEQKVIGHDREEGLRVVTIQCPLCSVVRRLWFRVFEPDFN
ncbi:MAG: hypothetical protein R3B48_12465 [Kofleriaceae bacterium]